MPTNGWWTELLASPRYGEHQARLWLDVIRYSDSNGFDWDEFRPQAWRFRDYVVRAFNADKPFDQFVREQLAGDELLAGPPRSAEEQDRLVATGYLRVGPRTTPRPLFNEQARARSDWLADLTETTGSAFLGVTLSCCRCHDHKFDPISQADHFRLRAFFQPVRNTATTSRSISPKSRRPSAASTRKDRSAWPPRKERKPSSASGQAPACATNESPPCRNRNGASSPCPTDPQPQDFKEQAAAVAKKVVSDDDAVKAATDEEKESASRSSDAPRSTGSNNEAPVHAGFLATDTPNRFPPTRIHFQGDHKAERDPVPPGFLSVLDPNPAVLVTPPSTNTTGRRLTLATWIARRPIRSPRGSIVNRAWQAFFGRGLVATPNDFGLAGARPSHPELARLAGRRIHARGLVHQTLHRLLVTSATYRQVSRGRRPPGDRQSPRSPDRTSAGCPPSNCVTRCWRWPAPSNIADGGPPAWPELPADVLQANPAFLDDNAEKTKGWYPSPPDRRSVRSLFLVQKRTVKVPFLETFDLPDNSTSCPRGRSPSSRPRPCRC
jgi:hypothetical protein